MFGVAAISVAAAIDVGCRTSLESACVAHDARRDPAADSLFGRDPRWLGGDAAYSIALGGDRVLWLFGDSFVAKNGSSSRRDAFVVRNSVGLETGRDPASASLQFFTGGSTAAPTSFLPDAVPNWYWPTGGTVANGTLLLTWAVERTSTNALGFEAAGVKVTTTSDFAGPPSTWALVSRPFPMPSAVPLVLLAPVAVGDDVYVYAIREPGDHAVSVAKVRRGDVALGDFSRVLWFGGDRGWLDAGSIGTPASIFPGSGPDLPAELSVSVRPNGALLAVHSVGTDLAVRTANHPEGPWSAPCPFFTPPESRAADPFVYAGKAHAELLGADLTVTYVASSTNPDRLLDDASLYRPRFVRATLDRFGDAGLDEGRDP